MTEKNRMSILFRTTQTVSSKSRWPQKLDAPFVHKFQTKKYKYLFDVNTGHILRVDHVIWDIVDDFGRLTKENLIQKYSHRFNAPNISSACDRIADTQQCDKLLLAQYPERIVLISEQQIQGAVENNCQCLVLNVTEDCNFKCAYCVFTDVYRDWPTHTCHNMNWVIARAAINDFLEHSDYRKSDLENPRYITFYGGEPLLNFKLIRQCVTYVRGKKENDDIVFGFTTNGSLLTGAAADFVASENFDINISLDGPAHIHNRWRRYRDGVETWDTIVTNIAEFLEKHPEYKTNQKLQIICTLTPFANIMDINDFFTSHKLFSQIQCELTLTVDGGNKLFESIAPEHRYGGRMKVLEEKFFRNLSTGAINANPNNRRWRIQRRLFEQDYRDFHTRDIAKKGKILTECLGPRSACIPGVKRTLVDVDGNYYPCERMPSTKQVRIGNVRDGKNLHNIYNLIRRFYHFNETECLTCWCVRNCHFGCYSDIIASGGLKEHIKQKECNLYRQHMHSTLVHYCEINETNPHAFDYLRKDQQDKLKVDAI